MKITFVGTSHGLPQKDRYCSCYMIEAGDGIYFVDAGTSFSDAMRDYHKDSMKLKAVFTTHPHSDHTGGIVSGISTLAWRKPELIFQIWFTSQAMIDAYKRYLSATFYCPNGENPTPSVEFCLANSGEIYRDENISVTYFPTQHLDTTGDPAYGMVIKELGGDNASVLFSGDLSYKLRSNDYPQEAYNPHDLFVCEMAHFYPKHIEEYYAKSKVKGLAITHLHPVVEKVPLINDMATRLPYPVKVVADGDVVEIKNREAKWL
ncbi:MAG: ribonuclease Z [Clostridia bacterium]|nr:ribonuclease Z [Clostridia bacterium]